MSEVLPHITVETGKDPQHSVIWLHGLGANGEDFVPLAKEMDLPVAVRYIFPHAPMQPVTINGGYVMRAWYDILTNAPSTLPGLDASPGLITDLTRREDGAGIRTSQAEIEKLLAQEKQRGVAARNIYLAGFSQGGAIALHTGLRHPEMLGGILALSSYLPLAESLAAEASTAATRTPIFMAHGTNDPIVPYTLGRASMQKLLKLGYQLEWREYPMPHSVCMEEEIDIEGWLAGKMAA